MAVKMRVTYSDGRVEDVLASPLAQYMTEEKFAGINDGNRIRASYYLAWCALHKAGKEAAQFDGFLASIADIEDLRDEEITADEVDPTNAEPPTISLPDSPS